MSHPSFFNWSGGKDSALALYHVLREQQHTVQTLLTTVNGENNRISMHGVRTSLLHEQARSIGIPLMEVPLSEQSTMSAYEETMKQSLQLLQQSGCTHSIFGDIFLEDLRRYREDQLAAVNMKAVFPLWKRNTTELLLEFLDLGFKTVIVCVNSSLLDQSFAGRIIDRDFLKDLPADVDPCGENGEFHSFVFDGPLFSGPINFTPGELVYREYKSPSDSSDNCFNSSDKQSTTLGFWYRDLLPVSKPAFSSI